MKQVFIAIGGSGTKVAEALVGLLALGCPTRKSRNNLTSVGDELEIWRVDADQSSGANSSLAQQIAAYQQLREAFEEGWSVKINPEVKKLNPLNLPQADALDNVTPSIRGVLNSYAKDETQLFIDLFYTAEEQNENISRGFYQKPFIGASIMAIYADSLPRRAAQLGLNLANLTTTDTRFFICGSLHGGTGASGVPVFGRFLKEQNPKPNWRISACLLAPYCNPPQPFISEKDARELTNRDQILDWFKHEDNKTADELFSTSEEKVDAVLQIAKGFYAKNNELIDRSKHNLKYYDQILMKYFDQVYVVGKHKRETLPKWSNGGANQNNPTNSAEVVAALTALNFFAENSAPIGVGNYIVASSMDSGINPITEEGMALHHLPEYKVGGQAIDPEKVILATLLSLLLIAYDHRWSVNGYVEEWTGDRKLGALYQRTPDRKAEDGRAFITAATTILTVAQGLLGPGAFESLGWHHNVWSEVSKNLPANAHGAEARLNDAVKGLFRKADVPKIGNSRWPIDFAAFRSWALSPDESFNRGIYFRFVWSEIYQKIESNNQNRTK
jgi:hypothetical protein